MAWHVTMTAAPLSIASLTFIKGIAAVVFVVVFARLVGSRGVHVVALSIAALAMRSVIASRRRRIRHARKRGSGSVIA